MWQTIAMTLIPSILVAVVTAFITVRLSLRQFRTQRWWERKADSYARIVESLHHLIDYCESHAGEEASGFQIATDRRKQLEEAYSAAFDELTKAANVGSFIISKQATDVLDKLRRQDKSNCQTEPAYEIYAGDAHVYRQALEEIIGLGKNDLRVG